MSEPAQLLDIFDHFWFGLPIFTTTKPSPDPSLHALPEPSRTVLHALSMSDTEVTVSPALSVSISPCPVLSPTPKLETIVSGKEAADSFGDGGSSFVTAREEVEGPGERKRMKVRRKRWGLTRTSSKSLSELEFEELKGFMDLGFVFSERDRDSADLVSIIPGLQRLATTETVAGGVSRPYLSEAWGPFERQRKALPMTTTTSWRVPEIGNSDERAVKDQLKFWAQAVASAVR